MKLLLATYNYPPESYGGSETYIEQLTAELTRAGHNPEVVAGSTQTSQGKERFSLDADNYSGIPVWRFRLDPARFHMPEMYTTRAADLHAFWKSWLEAHRPDVLHLHGHSLAASLSMMEAAADLNIPMVFTLHNAILLCIHGDYITWKGTVCDGRAALGKCAHCVTASRLGWPAGVAMAALTPLLSGVTVPNSSHWSKVESAFRFPALLRMHLAAQSEMLGIVRRWHVFSEWSRKALELNGVSHEKTVLLRHPAPEDSVHPAKSQRGQTLRLGYFGRFNKIKGIPVLLEAMRLLPDAPLQLEIFGEEQDAVDVGAQVRSAAAGDSRIVLRGRIPHSAQNAALAGLDVVVVPSQVIETGPLAVLEAFAARVPVVGSDISGINEWVREGRSGWLFPMGDAAALAKILARLAANPSLLDAAREFPPLDSLADHTRQVIKIYTSLFPGKLA